MGSWTYRTQLMEVVRLDEILAKLHFVGRKVISLYAKQKLCMFATVAGVGGTRPGT